MKKMTKKDRVEEYLENLMHTEGFTAENLMNMTVYDLFGNAELEGIGKTTLSGALNSFKKKYGLKKQGKGGLVPVKNTKKERVERYLTKLMKSPEFGVDDLMNLTVYDLFGNSELEGIGKTTLSSGISAFKKKYLKIQYTNDEEDLVNESPSDDDESFDGFDGDDEETFEDVFINAISREEQKDKDSGNDDVRLLNKNGGAQPKTREISATNAIYMEGLDDSDIHTLKSMINRYKNGQMNIMPSENLELVELKHALKHFGIDFKMILEHYRKNVES